MLLANNLNKRFEKRKEEIENNNLFLLKETK